MRDATKHNGLTLVELLIVVAVLAIIAAIAIPSFMASRLIANENATIGTLKSLATTQQRVQTARAIDANSDGNGEFGYLQELVGVRPVRTGSPASGVGSVRLTPIYLSGAFGLVDEGGLLVRSGYFFRVFLPGVNGSWLGENGRGDAYPPVDAGWAQAYWACYAWPGSMEASGRRVFFVNQKGDIVATDNLATRYSGRNHPPPPSAALRIGSATTSMNQSIAVNATGLDGTFWRLIN